VSGVAGPHLGRGRCNIDGGIDGGRCARCAEVEKTSQLGQGLFLQLLQAADQTPAGNLIRALFDPELFSTFVR